MVVVDIVRGVDLLVRKCMKKTALMWRHTYPQIYTAEQTDSKALQSQFSSDEAMDLTTGQHCNINCITSE